MAAISAEAEELLRECFASELMGDAAHCLSLLLPVATADGAVLAQLSAQRCFGAVERCGGLAAPGGRAAWARSIPGSS